MSTTSGMFERLALTNIANCDVFTGQGIPTAWGRLYGGQAVTQALMAAHATLSPASPDLHVHSLHGYFILAGNPAIPILFEVERVRDGRSFATRTVKAIQENRCIFQMTASFHADEPGPSYHIPIADVRAHRKAGEWMDAGMTPSPENLIKRGRQAAPRNRELLHLPTSAPELGPPRYFCQARSRWSSTRRRSP